MAQAADDAREASDDATITFQDAERHYDAGDEDGAKRLLKISLQIHKLPEAEALLKKIEKWGAHTEIGQTVARILAAEDHYAVLGLPRYSLASEDDIEKRHKKLAIKLHPDRCKARDATKAFQCIGEAKVRGAR